MKSTLLLLVSCTALSFSARAAGSTFAGVGEIPVASIAAKVKANGDDVTLDTARVSVALRLGLPDAVTPDGTWLYHNYVLRKGARDVGRLVTLVIRFEASRVSQLTLASRATAEALRSEPRDPAHHPLLAATLRR